MTVNFLLSIVKFMVLVNLVENKLILKQVVILNRHSLRTPLSNNLKDVSPKLWPKWDEKPGYLTAKGAKLAGYMGSYFGAWLKKEELLPPCPSEDDFYVMSNSAERTLTSAQEFVEKGFPDCKINVHHAGFNIADPLFSSIIHNTSETFKENVLEDMHEALRSTDLNEAFQLISDIVDYEQSKVCEIDRKCNLAKDENYINIIPGFRPRLSGPVKLCNEIIDAFLMQCYQGFPANDVAWGQLNDVNSWQTVVQISKAYFDITYKTKFVARDISNPLIKYISDTFFLNRPKVTLLVGHDVNIHAVLKALSVRPYSLEKQIESIPIGSAVVFQKWMDDESLENYFKLSFVYQSTEQLRNADVLSLENPPYIKTLEIEKCKIDNNGFCPWHDFRTYLGSL